MRLRRSLLSLLQNAREGLHAGKTNETTTTAAVTPEETNADEGPTPGVEETVVPSTEILGGVGVADGEEVNTTTL